MRKEENKLNRRQKTDVVWLEKGVQTEAPGSVQIIGVIHDCEPGKASTDEETHNSHQPRECDIPSSSLFTMPKYSRKSTSSSSESLSHQIDMGIDCAGIILNCLFCRFYDLFLMLPASCERATYSCCPTYQQFSITVDNTPSDDWNCDFDCGICDACHDTGECLELAMEMSEICYH
ncbi:myoD family inhibitor domain-containing protein 2 [Osmerus mordax]|uniref:myoD family inhibitor domain-containing protein 2 n=1 Tax=Osmerus mordax TaxID=8014 RepID=UPI00350FBC4B